MRTTTDWGRCVICDDPFFADDYVRDVDGGEIAHCECARKPHWTGE